MNKQHIIGLVLFVFGAVTTVNATFVQSAIGNLPSAAEEMGEQMVAHLPQECPDISKGLDEGSLFIRAVNAIFSSEIKEGGEKFTKACDGFVAKVKAIPSQVGESVKGQIQEVHGTLSALIAAGLLSLVVGFALLWRKPHNAV